MPAEASQSSCFVPGSERNSRSKKACSIDIIGYAYWIETEIYNDSEHYHDSSVCQLYNSFTLYTRSFTLKCKAIIPQAKFTY